MNKRWEYNFEDKTWELYFTPYYIDIFAAKLYKDDTCQEDEWSCSYFDNKFDFDYFCGELEDIKKEIENCIYEDYIDESNYYLELAKSFKEE